MKKDECKPLWDFSINTDKMIEAKLIDMIRIKKGKKMFENRYSDTRSSKYFPQGARKGR